MRNAEIKKKIYIYYFGQKMNGSLQNLRTQFLHRERESEREIIRVYDRKESDKANKNVSDRNI